MIRERSSKAQVGPQSIETTYSLETEDRATRSRVSPRALPDLPARGDRRGREKEKNLRAILRQETKGRSPRVPKEPPKETPGKAPISTPKKIVEKIVEIPRPEDATLLPGMLHCPSTDGSRIPLLRQSIATRTCSTRQAEGYHKCSFCVHGKPRDLSGCGLPPLENSPSHLAESRM